MPILLLTATVTPPAGAVQLQRTDPGQRLDDYAQALQFYIPLLERRVFDAIVFTENSESDIGRLRGAAAASSARDRIEFISFQGLDYPPEFGRAYGELKLVDHAMRHSRLVQAAGPDTMVWKVTGRYIIRNIEKLLRVRPDARFVCHCRDLPRRWADMYVMGWTKRDYPRVLQGLWDHLKESELKTSAEQAFRHQVDALARMLPVQRRFAVPPIVVGARGLDNSRYEQRPLPTAVRSVMNVLAPWIWI
jgi:hypothetical protein